MTNLKAYIVSDSNNSILTELEAKDAKSEVLEDEVCKLKARIELKTKYAELTDSYDSLMFDYETLKLKIKMLEIKNRDLKAKLNKSEKIQELVYDGLGDK
jgi:uncharacterized protein YutD